MTDYKKEYENCMAEQQKLLKALTDCNEKEKTEFIALSQNDSQSSQNILLEKHYLDRNIIGSTDECSYRFNIKNGKNNSLFCIKHGSLEAYKAYEVYQKQQKELDLKTRSEDIIWITIGIVIFIYFVFIDKGKLP